MPRPRSMSFRGNLFWRIQFNHFASRAGAKRAFSGCQSSRTPRMISSSLGVFSSIKASFHTANRVARISAYSVLILAKRPSSRSNSVCLLPSRNCVPHSRFQLGFVRYSIFFRPSPMFFSSVRLSEFLLIHCPILLQRFYREGIARGTIVRSPLWGSRVSWQQHEQATPKGRGKMVRSIASLYQLNIAAWLLCRSPSSSVS